MAMTPRTHRSGPEPARPRLPTVSCFVLGVTFSLVMVLACAQVVAGPTERPGAVVRDPATPLVPRPTSLPGTQGGRGKGDKLTILWWQAPTLLNPHLGQGLKDSNAARPVLEPLAAMGPDGKPIAYLAAEIPTLENGGISRDLRTVTWKLRPGVSWSDGSDFTADDVVFTYRYVADKATGASTSATAEGVESVEAKDRNTVVVTWKAPNPNSYQLFTSFSGVILQKKQFQSFIGDKAKDAPGNRKPIGTGPYKVKEFWPGDVVVYELNDLYREPDKPFFREVQLKGGGDATSAARAVFQTGAADYAGNLQVEAAVLRELLNGGHGDLVVSVGPQVERLLLNRADPGREIDGVRSEPSTRHPFLSDLAVRQAIAMAVDRTAIAAQLYGEGLTGQATTNIITAPPALASVNTAQFDAATFDLRRANQLLDESGWLRADGGVRQKGGIRLRVLFQTSINPLRQKTQAILKSGWEQLGIEVELKSVDAGVLFSSDLASPDTAAKFYADVQMFTSGGESPDPTNYLANWTTNQLAQRSNGWRGQNIERYSNPAYDAAWEELRKETDPNRRTDLVIALNDLLVNDVVAIPLIARMQPTAGKSKQLQGVRANPWEVDLWNIADWTRSSL
jgi:peptide/nickel transport system substrate-binding protein